MNICLIGHCYVQTLRECFDWPKVIRCEKYNVHCYYIKSEYSFLHQSFRLLLEDLCCRFDCVLNLSTMPSVNKYDKEFLDKGEWLPDRYPEPFKGKTEERFFVEQKYYDQTKYFLDKYPGLTLCHILRYLSERRKDYFFSYHSKYKMLYETFKDRSIDVASFEKLVDIKSAMKEDGVHPKGPKRKEAKDLLLRLLDYYYETMILSSKKQ